MCSRCEKSLGKPIPVGQRLCWSRNILQTNKNKNKNKKPRPICRAPQVEQSCPLAASLCGPSQMEQATHHNMLPLPVMSGLLVSLHLAKFQISFLLCLHWCQRTQVKSSLLPSVTPWLPGLPRQTGRKGYLVSTAVKSSSTSAYSSGLLVLFSTVSFDPQNFVILKSGLKGEMPELRIFTVTMRTG